MSCDQGWPKLRRLKYQTACSGVMRRVSPIVFSSRHSAMRPTIARLLLYEIALSTSFGENRRDFRSYFCFVITETLVQHSYNDSRWLVSFALKPMITR